MKKILLFISIIIIPILLTGCFNNKTKLIENKDYFIKGEFTGKYLDTAKRGYYIDTLNEPGAPYFYIICMGEKNTGGYSLKIKEVNKVDDKTEIIVEEVTPSEGDMVTMAFTYPTIIVEFPKYQENIVINNTKGELFDLLD